LAGTKKATRGVEAGTSFSGVAEKGKENGGKEKKKTASVRPLEGTGFGEKVLVRLLYKGLSARHSREQMKGASRDKTWGKEIWTERRGAAHFNPLPK